MNRKFEFKQLLRAYRAGVISETLFEQEMSRLETNDATAYRAVNGAEFRAFGRTYRSERAAVISFIDKARAAEANAAEAFRRWSEVCQTECLRSGLRMVAEREAYHARVFERRMSDLGAEQHATATEDGRKLAECLSDTKRTDAEKLLNFARMVGDADALIKPVYEFAALLREDLETKELLRLFAEDESSTIKWLNDACAALNAVSVSVSSNSAAQADH
jgi:hypothetical protein